MAVKYRPCNWVDYNKALVERERLSNTLRFIFNMTLRATQGFVESLLKLMNIHLKVPHYSTLNDPYQRDENIKAIRHQGKSTWKENSGYHNRSLSETVMFRLKSAFGLMLKSRKFENQAKEAFLKCKVLNIFATIGLANSEPVFI